MECILSLYSQPHRRACRSQKNVNKTLLQRLYGSNFSQGFDGENTVFMWYLDPVSGTLAIVSKSPPSDDLGVAFPHQVPSVLLLVVSAPGTLNSRFWQKT